MPRHTDDPVLRKVYQVNQRIYRINKKGSHSEALKMLDHNIKVANKQANMNISLSNPSKWTPAEKKMAVKIMDNFLESNTASVRGIKKVEANRDTSINKRIVEEYVKDLSPAERKQFEKLSKSQQKQVLKDKNVELTDRELDILYSSMTKARLTSSDLVELLGSKETFRVMSEAVKTANTGKAMTRRINQAIKYASEHEDYAIEDIENILIKTSKVRR